MSINRSIAARALEIMNAAAGPMYWHDAVLQSIREFYGDNVDAYAAALADGYAAAGREYKKSQYELPDQPTLFDIKPVLILDTPQGALAVRKDEATAQQVGEWLEQGDRYLSSQSRRFKAMRAQFQTLNLDPARNYLDQMKELNRGVE